MRAIAGVGFALASAYAFGAPPAGYVVVDGAPDGSFIAYVNPATIGEVDVYSYDSTAAEKTTLVLFEEANESKPKGKKPGSTQFEKVGVKCERQVMFTISPSSDGERLIYSSPQIVMTGTIAKSILDFVCAVSHKRKAEDAAWDLIQKGTEKSPKETEKK